MCLTVATANCYSVIERNIAFSTFERYSLLLCSGSWHSKFFFVQPRTVLQLSLVQLDKTFCSKTPLCVAVCCSICARRSAPPPSQMPPPTLLHHIWRSDLMLNIVLFFFFWPYLKLPGTISKHSTISPFLLAYCFGWYFCCGNKLRPVLEVYCYSNNGEKVGWRSPPNSVA